MSSHFLPKLTKYIPLWQRRIPPYPLYWKGNPQLRVCLPLFWMKMIKWTSSLPKDNVAFEVHPQMTKMDIKNYLEKIYGVPVLSVSSSLIRGKDRFHPKFGYKIQPERDRRIAWVQVAEGHQFEFPELFKDRATDDSKNTEDVKRITLESEKEERKHWSRHDLPPWFR